MSPKDQLVEDLEAAWDELARRGAVVNRIPTTSHPAILRVKLAEERRRLRALDEGGPR